MLSTYMNQFGSDKANGWHNYTKIYEIFLHHKACKNLLEIQESNSAHLHACADLEGSIKAWKHYFHSSSFIYGCKAENIYFNPDVELDVIIDDSGYGWQERRQRIEDSWCHLKNGGFYIVEDVLSSFIFQAYADLYTLHGKLKFKQCHVYELPNANNKYDNNMIVLQKSLDASNSLDNFPQPKQLEKPHNEGNIKHKDF